ncbi:hypothetical protein vBPMCPL1_0094 [Proteus phage vB_PMC-PL1]
MIAMTGRLKVTIQYSDGRVVTKITPGVVSMYEMGEVYGLLDTIASTLDCTVIDWEIIDDE